MKGLIIIISIGLLVVGGQALYTAVTATKPTTLTMEEYIDQRPEGVKWLELKDAELDVVSYFYQEDKLKENRPSEVYIPVMRPDAGENESIFVLLLTKDAEILDLVEELQGIESEAAVIQFLEANYQRFFLKRDVKGLVQFGLNDDSDARRQLKGLDDRIVDEFILVAHNKRPSWLKALAFPLGLVVLGALFFGGRRKEPPMMPQGGQPLQMPPQPQQPGPPPQQPGPPPQPPQQPQG